MDLIWHDRELLKQMMAVDMKWYFYQLGRDGVRFMQASTTIWCAPARQKLLAGDPFPGYSIDPVMDYDLCANG